MVRTLDGWLARSSVASEALATLIAEVERHCAGIAEVRPPQQECALEYAEWLQRMAQVRGRAALYPYLSSGFGRRAMVELADGSVKWDLICGIGVAFFGHSHPQMLHTALAASLSDVVKHGNLQCGLEPTRFSEALLAQASPTSQLRHCYLSTSGTMANENALKLAFQKHAPACRILAFNDCFMGRSLAMSQIGDCAANREGLPLQLLVDYVPFWDPAAAARMGKARFIDMCVWHLEQYLDRYPRQHACFVFEMVQGEGGFRIGDADFFRALMQVCRDRQVAVWDDEIQTFGRTEQMFAYEMFGLGELIDLVTVGKLTQTCATLYIEAYNPRPGLLSGTFLSDNVSLEVGSRVIELLATGDHYGKQGRFAQHQRTFLEHAEALQNRHPRWFPAVPQVGRLADGVGGMLRLTAFGGKMEHIVGSCKAIFDAGAIVFWCGHDPYHIRLLPPLPVLELADWQNIFSTLEAGLAAYAASAGL